MARLKPVPRCLLRTPGLALVTLLALAQPAGASPNQESGAEPAARTIRAMRLEGEILLDGRLEEAAWGKAEPAADFTQRFPAEGLPASLRTEVRILYDAERLIIGARLFDPAPADLVAREMKEDSTLGNDDSFAVYLDTFHDKRNGYFFETNPLGARADALIFDEGRNNSFDWDGVWDVAAAVGDDGWSVEMAIPFRTLHFHPEGVNSWGLQLRRIIRRRAEDVWWSPIPRNESEWRMSRAGELQGLSDIRQGGRLDLKPYALGSLRERPSFAEEDAEGTGDIGLDARYALTPNLTATLTVNTDFAETEVDNQQVNITRFPLFFPEKREFFLESKGFFDFGYVDPGPGPPGIIPFFSRRIGLGTVQGRDEDLTAPIPIDGGLKLSGRLGRYNLGFLSVETGDEGASNPRTNYTALRVSRDILSRSNWGVIGVSKEPAGPETETDPLDPSAGIHSNQTYGADMNFSVFENLKFGGMALQTRTPGLESGEGAGRAYVVWSDNVWEVEMSHTDIASGFNPEAGFVQRTGIEETVGRLGWSWRSPSSLVRRIAPHTRMHYTTDQEHQLATRFQHFAFAMELRDGSSIEAAWNPTYDRLDDTFELSETSHVPAGSYQMDRYTLHWQSDASRLFSASLFGETGEFFDGDFFSIETSIAARISRHLRSILTASRVEIDLPERLGGTGLSPALTSPEPFNTTLLQTQIGVTFTTRLFLDLLVQHNTDVDDLSTNLRFNYKYRPGSDLYVVYTERRDIEGLPTDIVDRIFTVKWTYLFSL